MLVIVGRGRKCGDESKKQIQSCSCTTEPRVEEVKQTVSLNLSSLCSDLLTGQSDSCKDQPLLVLFKMGKWSVFSRRSLWVDNASSGKRLDNELHWIKSTLDLGFSWRIIPPPKPLFLLPPLDFTKVISSPYPPEGGDSGFCLCFSVVKRSQQPPPFSCFLRLIDMENEGRGDALCAGG